MASNRFKVNQRLYKDADGNVVLQGDPAAQTLFLTPGKTISMALATELGLVDAASEETKVKTPSKNKMATPSGKKAGAPAGKAMKPPTKSGGGKSK